VTGRINRLRFAPWPSVSHAPPVPALDADEVWPPSAGGDAAVAGYTAQLGFAIALLADTDSAALQRALVIVVLVLYASGPGRAWEVAVAGTRSG
jgi:hypothetical protein